MKTQNKEMGAIMKTRKCPAHRHMVKKLIFGLLTTVSLFGCQDINAQQTGDGYNSYIGVWGGGGYARLQHSINGTSVQGGLGALIGTGYQGSYDQWMFKLGAEFYYLNSATKINDYTESKDWLYVPKEHYITYNYGFESYKDKQSTGYINIPLMAGYRFNERFYLMVGAKYGLNLFGDYTAKGMFSTTADDPEFIETMTGIPSHGIQNGLSLNSNGSLKFASNIVGSAEFGIYLDEWIYGADNARRARRANNANARPAPNRPSYRMALFVDYGISDIQKNQTTEDLVQYAGNRQNDPTDIANRALFASNRANKIPNDATSASNKINSLLVGAKLTVLFQLAQERRPPAQRHVRPRFVAQVVDSETNANLDAQVLIKRKSTGVQVFKSMSNRRTGQVSRVLNSSEYILEVSKNDYYTYIDTITTTEVSDTLIIPLKKKPTLSILVIDAESREILEAEVVVENTATDIEEFKGTTDKTSGLLSKIVEDGSYSISVNRQGYMSSTRTIDNISKSNVIIELSPIIEDRPIILRNLFFDFDQATIKEGSEQTLEELYELLKDNLSMTIKITGHTDNVGSDAYNQRLSENRAKSVKEEMVKRGIEASRITYEGMGSREPITTNDTDEGRAENRRVEFTIISK